MNRNYNAKMGRRRTHNKSFPQHLHNANGTFYYVIRINGKYRWLSLKTRDIGLALTRWAKIEAFYREQKGSFDPKQVVADKETITFQKLTERFLSEVAVHNAISTQKNYKRMCQELNKTFGSIQVNKITRQAIIRYHDNLRKTPFEANRRVALIRLLFQKALDWGYLNMNVAHSIKKFKEHKYKLKLTEHILFKEIYPVAAPMLKRAIILAFNLVQHENEVKKLQWTHFDMENHVVSFIRQKTDEPIVIDYSTNPVLIGFLEHLKASRRELSPYLICKASPKGWQPYSHFRSMWSKALEDAKYAKGSFKFKEIRHLANTLMKKSNIAVEKRMAMTGHKTIQANEIYTHPTGGDTADCSKALSKYRPDNF